MISTVEISLANTTDQSLLQSYAHDGSQDAFGALVHRYVDLVYSTSLRRVHDSHLAEDVTQAVFFILAKKAARLSPQIVLAGWLYQTARRVSSDAMKMNARRQHHENAAAAMQQTSASEQANWDEISPHLESAMDRLGRKDREALLLRFFKGLSVQEIADALSIPPNTASKRINRALDKLRLHLAAHGATTAASALSGIIASDAVRPASAGLSANCNTIHFAPHITDLAKRALAAGKYTAVAYASAAASAAIICMIAFTEPRVVSSAPEQSAKTVAAPVAPTTTQASLASVLETATPQQEMQIRLAIYRINHSSITAEGDKWTGAIKELAEIGRPAVPELVAELDRTSRDSTLRAFGFVLRVIGDVRACPALARALARTSVRSNGFGAPLRQDSKVDKFIYQHQIGGPKGAMTLYAPAIQEIASALETITSHQEGRSGGLDAKQDIAAELNAARARHEAFSKKWQAWWDLHHNEYVSNADLATLTTHPDNETTIDTAGISVYGPLFPTGKPYHLGPIHNVVLHPGQYDIHELIDFDAQTVMTYFDACRILPPGMKDSRRLGAAASVWYSTQGAGADGYCLRYSLYSNHKDIYTLYGIDNCIWPADDSRWGTLDDEISSGRPILLDPDGPFSSFDYRDPQYRISVHDHFPATSLFRTREGGAGIIQLLESDIANKAVHFRYRMVEPHPKSFVPRQPSTLPTAAPFGASHTVTLTVPSTDAACAIDLVSGKLFKAPEEDLQDSQDPLKWVRVVHADIATMAFSNPTRLAGLRAADAALILVSKDAWDALSPSLVSLALDHSEDGNVPYLIAPTPNQKQDFTGTAMFRTTKSISGLIQITNTTDNPPAITFRYKLIGEPTTQPTH